jgi:HD-GYP domain-containing protein (c-di-GMP phosphodiesterase class II)
MSRQTSNTKSGIKNVPNNTGDAGRVEEQIKPIQILIPMELDRKNRTFGFFALNNDELPEGSQHNLNEITGTPFKAELAGLTVYVGPVVQNLQENYCKALFKLADSIDRCDQSSHSQNTALWAKRIAESMRLSEDDIYEITLAGRLHDIGKAVVPIDLLTKPGPLCEDEWIVIKRHAEYSAALMEPSQSLKTIIPMVRSHHEHFNGKGYSQQLSGQDIPLGARILAVADAFSTMTTGRAYRAPISFEAAQTELVRCSSTQFDPDIVKAMIIVLRRFNTISPI